MDVDGYCKGDQHIHQPSHLDPAGLAASSLEGNDSDTLVLFIGHCRLRRKWTGVMDEANLLSRQQQALLLNYCNTRTISV